MKITITINVEIDCTLKCKPQSVPEAVKEVAYYIGNALPLDMLGKVKIDTKKED